MANGLTKIAEVRRVVGGLRLSVEKAKNSAESGHRSGLSTHPSLKVVGRGITRTSRAGV